MRLKRYVPFPYWLTVVVVSVTGTLYTDILTDRLNVPLWLSSAVFSVLLAAVFGLWWLRERTLSIHSVTTLSRESFYWLAVLVTFALGTATGDWILELTGWSPGVSVLLPLGLDAVFADLPVDRGAGHTQGSGCFVLVAVGVQQAAHDRVALRGLQWVEYPAGHGVAFRRQVVGAQVVPRVRELLEESRVSA
nr:hypothetical protein [Catenulispora pinistramenti]